MKMKWLKITMNNGKEYFKEIPEEEYNVNTKTHLMSMYAELIRSQVSSWSGRASLYSYPNMESKIVLIRLEAITSIEEWQGDK